MYTVIAVIIVLSAGADSIAYSDAPRTVTPDELNDAIERLKQDLYSQQDPETGTWEDGVRFSSSTYGGRTALIVNAMLVSGDSPQDPSLKRAIDFLKTAELNGTYAVAVRAHVWALMSNRYLALLKRDAAWLLDAHDGQARFRYTRKPSTFDHSATQYALLGLWEAAKRGVRIPGDFWLKARNHFIQVQNPDGGWGYQSDSESKGSMTAAGLTALFITRQQIRRDLRSPPIELTNALHRGLIWLDRRFDSQRNITARGKSAGHYYYYLYSIERVAMASGARFFGGQDWYQRGTRTILDNMAEQSHSGFAFRSSLVEKAFAIMFLSRGRMGPWITKIAVPDLSWNDRPNDIYRLTKYLSDLCETQFNWEMVSIDHPTAVLSSAPVAYLTSDEPLNLNESQHTAIKQYLDHGGMLVASPVDGSNSFVRSIRRLAKQLYSQWPLRPLDRKHPIYHALYKVGQKDGQRLFGVSNGARDLIILTEHDWSGAFQNNLHPGRNVQWKLAANLFMLATDRGDLPGRLDVVVESRRARKIMSKIRIGRAKLDKARANLVVEPYAWTAMSNYLYNRTGIDVEIVDLELKRIDQSDLALVHLAGVEAAQLSVAEIRAAMKYVKDGGTLLVETVGGLGEFAASIERQLNETLESSPVPLPRQSALLTGESLEGGYDNRRVQFRRFAVSTLSLRHRNRLLAYMLEGRPAILVSHEDLSLGMLGVRLWKVLGYEIESARRVMSNIVIWCKQGTRGQKSEGSN